MQALPSVERIEAQTLRRQQIAFCLLTLVVIAALLLLHTYFAALLGEPSPPVIGLLALVFLAKLIEAVWLLRSHDGISTRAAAIATVATIIAIYILTGTLAVLTDRDDAPYTVLLAIPILQCAYRCGLIPTCLTIAGSIGMIFGWAQHYFRLHPPARPGEFLEAGMISVIYCIMGLLVWYLVSHLRQKELKIYQFMEELDSTRQKLAAEEKLAAVGRLASGIAHEIRNPVAMIASSLSTATDDLTDSPERDEMFAIAAREARRLEILTTDFLIYARPSPPQPMLFSITDIMLHVASLTRVRASDRDIEVRCGLPDEIYAEIDPSQIESALVNLGFNAVDATPDQGLIEFRIRTDGSAVEIEVENSGSAIEPANLQRIFEPFFTTKPTGTGLGLAIARNVAHAHGGDIQVTKNRNGAVAFSLKLPCAAAVNYKEEVPDGQSVDCRR